MLPDGCSADVTAAAAGANMSVTSLRVDRSLTVAPYHVTTLMTSSQHARTRQHHVLLTCSAQR